MKALVTDLDAKVYYYLLEVERAASAYRDATRAIVGGAHIPDRLGSPYDKAAAKLDGALNELRIAREVKESK